jgi:hypothetical protein
MKKRREHWTNIGAHHSLPVIQQCDDHAARGCVICNERRQGAHFRIRPPSGPGYRVVCARCLRAIVVLKQPRRRTARSS